MPEEITYLDRNENNYGPAPACYEVLRTSTLEYFSWYSKDFVRGVKSVLSERLAKEFGVPENSVLLGYGAEDLLKQAVHCYLAKDETILIPTHSWWYYKSIASEKGGISVEYPIVPGADSFAYDVESLLRVAAQHKPRLILISSPNNPTGNSLNFTDLSTILRKTTNAIIVLDEAYWGFGSRQTNDIKDLISEFPNLIIIRTFSKYYALAGIRIGFAFLGKNLTLLSQYSARYLGYNRLSERLALAALDSRDYYTDIGRKMVQDKETYYRELGRIPGFKAYRSDANFILADVPAQWKAALKDHLAQKKLTIKFFSEAHLENCVRITIGTQEQNRRLIEEIRAFATEKKIL